MSFWRKSAVEAKTTRAMTSRSILPNQISIWSSQERSLRSSYDDLLRRP